MSDTSALFLTTGEPYAKRALESVARQSLQPAEIVVVESETPFHRAFNAGVSRVRTEFFFQIDADFVLDPDCFAALRACMREEIGGVTGRLRDPLLGRIGAVRLFRTRCFEGGGFPDTVSPDTDFAAAAAAAGWRRLDALKRGGGPRQLWHTFGEHRPDYTPLYTFCKFRLTGAHCRYRRDPFMLRDFIARLHASRHEAARLALVALAHGVFLDDISDQLRPYSPDRELGLAVALVGAPPQRTALPDPAGARTARPSDRRDLGEVFARGLALGTKLASSGDAAGFVALLDRLGAAAPSDARDLVALLALCHGTFASMRDTDARYGGYAMLEGWGVA